MLVNVSAREWISLFSPSLVGNSITNGVGTTLTRYYYVSVYVITTAALPAALCNTTFGSCLLPSNTQPPPAVRLQRRPGGAVDMVASISLVRRWADQSLVWESFVSASASRSSRAAYLQAADVEVAW